MMANYVAQTQGPVEDTAAPSVKLYRWQRERLLEIVGMITLDLQSSASSLLYNSAFLAAQAPAGDDASQTDARTDILGTSRAISSLLGRLSDLVRLGEAARESASIESLVSRARLAAGRRSSLPILGATSIVGGATVAYTNPFLASAIISELLVNGSSFGAGAPIEITCRSVVVNDTPLVRLQVENEGVGVTAANEDKIFEPFYSTLPGHNGLGLTIARETARSLGGDVVLEHSRKPTRFVLLLPGVSGSGDGGEG